MVFGNNDKNLTWILKGSSVTEVKITTLENAVPVTIFSILGNFCPLCDKCYDDDDYDSKMMECGRCKHWVHAKCESLTGQ